MRVRVLAVVLSFAAASAFAGSYKVTCTNWQFVDGSINGTVATYHLTGECEGKENGHTHDNWSGSDYDWRRSTWLKLDVTDTYDSKTKVATEVLSGKGTEENWVEGNADHTEPVGPLGMTSKATCQGDPFAEGTVGNCGTPTRTKTPYNQVVFPFDMLDTKNPASFNGGPMPVFWSSHKVAAGYVAKMKAKVLETGLAAPKLTAPVPDSTFYGTPVHVKALIPDTYNQLGEICCTMEIQKNDNGNWLPPFTLNQGNLDTQSYTIPFSSFTQMGYGKYRIRVSPMKNSPTDAVPFSDFVVFTVLPKEVIEVPNVIEPAQNASVKGALSVQFANPTVAKNAGYHCCEIDIQVQKNGAWTDVLQKIDSRFDNPVPVQFDVTSFGSGNARLRGRLVQANDAQAANLPWSDWRTFTLAANGMITGVTLTPQHPAPGTQVTLTAQGTGNCRVLFQTGGAMLGAAQTIDQMNAPGPFPIQATFTLTKTSGMYTITAKPGDPTCGGQASVLVQVTGTVAH